MTPPPRLAFWSAVAAVGAALFCPGNAWNVTNAGNTTSGLSNATMDPTTFFQDPAEVLAVPLRRVDQYGVGTPSLARRFFKTDVLGVYGAAYLAQLDVGTSTKKQNLSVLLDTGSFELWVNPDCEKSAVPKLCRDFGHYDPARSSTSRNLNQPFAIKYGSGTTYGTYYRDDIYINGARIKNQQFGVSTKSDTVWFGIMGLAHGIGNGFLKYPTVIDSLAAQNYTQSKLFSLDLGGQVPSGLAKTGQLVFGGVDRNKYSGNLRKVPTDPRDAHYKVSLSGISHRAPGSNAAKPVPGASFPVPIIVDSGTTLSLLPKGVVASLAVQFSGAKSDNKGGYTVPCEHQARDGSVVFAFGPGVSISVAYRDFIWRSGSNCFLGAWYTPDVGVYILGDTFLRGAYVAFDQDNHALYMTNYTSCNTKSSLVPVPAGRDAAARIPGACRPPAAKNVFAAPSSSSISATSVAGVSSVSPIKAISTSASAPTWTTASTPDRGRLPALEPQPTGTTTTTTTAASDSTTRTYTRTLTSAVVYSYTDADAAGQTGPALRFATSFSTYTTTYCSAGAGPEETGARLLAAPAADEGPQEPTEAPAPAPAPPAADESPQEGEAPPPQPPAAPTAEGSADIELKQAQPEVTVDVVTEHCSTETYAVTACAADAGPDCTVGMQTTRVITELQTLQAVQTPSAETAVVAAVGHSAPAPLPLSLSLPVPAETPVVEAVANPAPPTALPTTTTVLVAPAPIAPAPTSVAPPPAVAVDVEVAEGEGASAGVSVAPSVGSSWPMTNSSAANGVAAPPDCVSCRVVNVAPTAGVAVVAGASRSKISGAAAVVLVSAAAWLWS